MDAKLKVRFEVSNIDQLEELISELKTIIGRIVNFQFDLKKIEPGIEDPQEENQK